MTAATRGQPDRGDKTAGRRGASGARPMGTKGEKERGQTARQPRNTRQAGGAEDKRREDRKGGGTAAGREQGENEKKEIYKYLRERREEKRRRDSQKRVNMCIYISLNTVACWLFTALSFIYIKGVYCIYLYI